MAGINIGQVLIPKVPSRFMAKVKVANSGLYAGQVVNAKTLDNTIADNYEVFNATLPITSDLDDKTFALVLGGNIEELADGRRPNGNPDYTSETYRYNSGDMADVCFIGNHLMYEISVDVVENKGATANLDIGKFLVPTNNTYSLSVSNTSTACCLKIIGVRHYPLGGLFGGNYAHTYICVGYIKTANVQPVPPVQPTLTPFAVGDTVSSIKFNLNKSNSEINSWLDSLTYSKYFDQEFTASNLIIGTESRDAGVILTVLNLEGIKIITSGESIIYCSETSDYGSAGWNNEAVGTDGTYNVASQYQQQITEIQAGSWNGEIVGKE